MQSDCWGYSVECYAAVIKHYVEYLIMKVYRKLIINALVVLGVIGYILISINNLNHDMKDERARRLKVSVENAAVTCFAIEGFYPDSLDYLVDNYHIVYDPKEYHVFYETKGANFKPRVEVIGRSYEKE